ncbi:tetratricopeptide repeat protein [Bacteroidota bacterium]
MKLISYILLIILSIHISGQDNYIDSLNNEYNIQANKEVKFNLVLKITEFYLSNNPDTAQSILLTQEKILNKITNTQDLAKYNFLMGECFFNQNEYKEAIPYYEKSKELYNELNDEENVAENLHNIGLSNFYTGQYEQALFHYHEVLIIAEKNYFKERIANAYQNLGLVYNEIKTYSKAQQYFEKAIAINKEIQNEEKIAALYQNIGVIHHNKEKFDTALVYYTKSLEIYKKLEHKLGIASSYLNIGLIYETMKDNRAIDNYHNAKIIFEEINHARGVIYTLNSLCSYSKAKGYYIEAIDYLEQSISMGKKYHLTETLVEAYREASDVYSLINKHKEALMYYKKLTHLNDSLYNENNIRQILELEMKYQSEKFENKLKQEKIKNRIYIGGFILILIFFILYIVLFIKKK